MITKITILGVNISQITKKEAVGTIEEWLLENKPLPGHPEFISGSKKMPKQVRHDKQRFIATPNPEMLVLAQKDKEFCHILNSADMAIPDGIGLLWASKILSKTSPLPSPNRRGDTRGEVLIERVSGTDLMLDLCNMASQKSYTVGLLGAKEEVAQKTAQVLKEKFPGLKVKFALDELSSRPSLSETKASGGISLNRDSRIDKDYFNNKVDLSKIPRLRDAKRPFARNDSLGCDLLFVAFGAPKQEKWIYNQVSGVRCQVSGVQNNHKLLKPKTYNLKAKVYMGVGGAFDLISGKIKRAPKFMQKFGLEWLWRLIQEPTRIKRIWTATVVFPWLVLKNSLKTSHTPGV